MIAFLVDQNFNEHILDGLIRRGLTAEFIHVRDVGLAAAPDPTVLEWAANHALILLTHDRSTIPPFAYARKLRARTVRAGESANPDQVL